MIMTILVRIAIGVMQLFYQFFKLFPVKNKIVFISRQANEPSLDFNMLADEIKREHPDYETVMLCKMLNSGISRKIAYVLNILTQEYHMATSKAVILDSYCIAASVLRHRKSLLVIQMWHSVGTMKKFGYSILDKPEGSSSRIAHLMKMHHGYSYVLCAGEGYVDHLAQGFNVDPSIIKIFPLPRVELLQNKEHIEKKRREIFAAYPELDMEADHDQARKNDQPRKKNIVYDPTFIRAEDTDFDEALADLAAALDPEKYNLIVKAHPLSGYHGQKFETKSRFLTCDEFSSMDMLLVADAVISDYSCIIYEAAVLMKPLYFYTYDYDSYMSTRDIYMDYKKEIPGPMASDGRSLAEAIDDMDNYDMDRLAAFLRKYVRVTGHETRDISEFIFEHIEC